MSLNCKLNREKNVTCAEKYIDLGVGVIALIQEMALRLSIFKALYQPKEASVAC